MYETAPFSHEQIIEMFGYDSKTGDLLWKIRPSNRIHPGDVAGVIGSNGRRYISIDGKRFLAHRIVWFHQKAEWPLDNIVPENGDYLDTRLENLRSETAQQTASKTLLRSTNKSGVKGVSWDSVRQRWQVHAYRNYETAALGQFKKLADAIECKRNADIGIFSSDEEISRSNKARKMDNFQARRLWARMLRWSNGAHGWASMENFYNDVGDQPETNYTLERIDASVLIGPGNFQWVAPTHNLRTRDGRIAAGKEYVLSNYAKYRDKQLRRMFGIGSAEYDAKMDEQGGVCAICAQPETVTRKGKLLPLCVDHDHATNAVRSLLCAACNKGLGQFRDNTSLLAKAIQYLDGWRCGSDPHPTGNGTDASVPINGPLSFGA